MTETKEIFCCGCKTKVQARLTSGVEIYPHRPDLSDLPFWRCDGCKNYVGCHHKTNDRTNPLGNIPTKELRNARQHIHKVLDPLWKTGRMSRKHLYKKVSDAVRGKATFPKEPNWKYHTAKIRTVEEAREVYKFVVTLK